MRGNNIGLDRRVVCWLIHDFNVVGDWCGGNSRKHIFGVFDDDLIVKEDVCIILVFPKYQASGVREDSAAHDDAIVRAEG